MEYFFKGHEMAHFKDEHLYFSKFKICHILWNSWLKSIQFFFKNRLNSICIFHIAEILGP